MLSGGTQHRALPRYQSEEMIMLNIYFSRIGIESTAIRFTVTRLYLYTTHPI